MAFKTLQIQRSNDIQEKTNGFKSLTIDRKQVYEPVKTSFKERLTGAPTKQRDGSYKANTGVLPFLGEVGKNLYGVVTGNPQNVGSTLGQSLSVNRGDFNALNKANQEKSDIKLNLIKTINKNKELGKDNTSLLKAYNDLNSTDETIQTLAPKSQISNKQAIGELLDVGSSMLGVGALTAGKTALIGGKTAVNSFKLLSKVAQKEIIKNMTAKEIMANLAKETTINTGIGYGVDVSNNLSQDKKGAAMFKPGLGTAFGALATAGLGGQEAARLQKANSATRIESKYAQKFNVPEAGSPLPGYQNKFVPQLESPKIQLPGEGILKSSEDLRNPKLITQPEIPKSPIIKEAEKFISKQDYINYKKNNQSNLSDLIKAKKITTLPGQKVTTTKLNDLQLGKIWEEAHTTPKQEGLPPLQQNTPKINTKQPTFDPATGQPNMKQEIPTQEIPKTKEQTFKEQADTIDSKAQSETNNNPIKVDSINIKAEGEKAVSYIETFGKDKARRVALKLDGEPEGVRASAVLAELKNQAQKEGDFALATELAISDARKMSSQEINLAKLEDPNSFDLQVKDIYESKRKKQNIVTKMNEKSAINSIAQKLRKAVESVNLDNFSIKKLAASLMCK